MFVIALFYLVYFILLHRFNFNLIAFMGVPVLEHSFADLRGITSGWDCQRLGYDPFLENPCDPWGRRLIYPRTWQIFSFLNIGQANTIGLGSVLAILFYCCILILAGNTLRIKEVLIWAAVSISPKILFAIERGNSDLIIFILMMTAVYCYRQHWAFSSLIIYFSFTLKLYPIFGIPIALEENKKRSLRVIAFLLAGVFIYSIMNWQELITIHQLSEYRTRFSYGNHIFIHHFSGFGDNFAGIHLHYRYFQLISWVLTILCIAAVYYWVKTTPIKTHAPSLKLDSFRVGSSLYLGTFLMGYTYEYKMIFLAFAIPQLLEWAKQKESPLHQTARLCLIILILVLWYMPKGFSSMGIFYTQKIIEDALEWGTFSVLLFLVLISRPHWLKI